VFKLFSGVFFSTAIVLGNITPVSASPAILNTSSNAIDQNVVVQKSSLVEIEGRTLGNSEAVKVEGQFSRVQIPRNIQVGICAIGVVSPCNRNVPPNWQIQPRPVSTMPIVRPNPPTSMPIIRPLPWR